MEEISDADFEKLFGEVETEEVIDKSVINIRNLLYKINVKSERQIIILRVYIPDLINLVLKEDWVNLDELLFRIRREVKMWEEL